MIKAITFDLWDTVFIDDSDEPKRKAANRPTKAVERRDLVEKFVNKHNTVPREIIDVVYNTTDAAFRKVWHDTHVTWSVRDRLDIIFKGLDTEISAEDMSEIVRLHEEMELEFRPNFVPGVHDAIKKLKQKYKLGVISDAIFSPGRVLRQLLDGEGLKEMFDVFVFSDEVGHSKPYPTVFEAACKGLDAEPHEIVHIGDREHNDILGPLKAGFGAVLCTAALDRDSANTKANAIFSDYSELYDIMESLQK